MPEKPVSVGNNGKLPFIETFPDKTVKLLGFDDNVYFFNYPVVLCDKIGHAERVAVLVSFKRLVE